jgi:hypothetical protein
MRFLRNTDYYRLIQPKELTTLLQTAVTAGYDGTQLLIDSENAAIEEIKGYLSARYDLDRIFSDTPIYNASTTYYGQSRVQYHETAYSATSTYAVGNRASINNNIYQCSVAITVAEAFNPSHWTFVCLDYAIFSAILPNAEFKEFINYPKNSTVWFSDNYTYTALKNTTGQLLNAAVYSEYGADKDQPMIDTGGVRYLEDISNNNYWLRNSIYSFSAILPTDGTKWQQVDNRNGLMINCVIDIVLYNLFTILAPRNVPAERITRYKGESTNDTKCTVGWLKAVSCGELSANLPNKYPTQGLSIIFNSGAPKSNNTY